MRSKKKFGQISIEFISGFALFMFVVMYIAFTVINNAPLFYQSAAENNLNMEAWTFSEKVLSHLTAPEGAGEGGLVAGSWVQTDLSGGVNINTTVEEGDLILARASITTKLQEADTENIEDTFVYEQNPTSNYGGFTALYIEGSLGRGFSYLKFNLSSLPQSYTVEDALLALYHYQTSSATNVKVYHVYGSVIWDETTYSGAPLNWNNQPCDMLTNDTNCNLTYADITNFSAGNWGFMDVTTIINNVIGSDNVSFLVTTNQSTAPKMVYSKEYTDTTLRPYLNITYPGGEYKSSGIFASQVKDLGSGNENATWTQLDWTADEPADTNIADVWARASDTSFLKNDTSPSWTLVGTSPAAPIDLTAYDITGRYFQWRFNLTTTNTSKTPTLHNVTATYSTGVAARGGGFILDKSKVENLSLCTLYNYYDKASMSNYSYLRELFDIELRNDFHIGLREWPILTDTIWLEAEDFENGTGAAFVNVSGASKNFTAEIRDDWAARDSTSATEYILGEVNTTTAGTYIIWVRYKDSAGGDFQASFDGGAFVSKSVGASDEWKWTSFTYDDLEPPLQIKIESDHASNGSAFIDALLVTKDAAIVPLTVKDLALGEKNFTIERIDSENALIFLSRAVVDCGKLSSLGMSTAVIKRFAVLGDTKTPVTLEVEWWGL